jgi:hypothetical protein
MKRSLLSTVSVLAMFSILTTTATDAGAAIKHRYSFTADVTDSISGANGSVVDAGAPTATFGSGQLNLTGNVGNPSNNIAEDAYVNLPNGIISDLGTTGTFEMWVTVAANQNWAEIFSFGQSRQDTGGEDLSSGFGKYVTLIPDTGDGANTFRLEAIQFPDGSPGFAPFGASNVSSPNNTTLPTGVEHHIVSIFDSTDTSAGPNGTMRNYLNGVLVGSVQMYAGFTLGGLPDFNNWLGRSQWPDPLFDGSYNEFRIYDNALTAAQVAVNGLRGPDVVLEPTAAVLAGLASIAAGCRGRRRLET